MSWLPEGPAPPPRQWATWLPKVTQPWSSTLVLTFSTASFASWLSSIPLWPSSSSAALSSVRIWRSHNGWIEAARRSSDAPVLVSTVMSRFTDTKLVLSRSQQSRLITLASPTVCFSSWSICTGGFIILVTFFVEIGNEYQRSNELRELYLYWCPAWFIFLAC